MLHGRVACSGWPLTHGMGGAHGGVESGPEAQSPPTHLEQAAEQRNTAAAAAAAAAGCAPPLVTHVHCAIILVRQQLLQGVGAAHVLLVCQQLCEALPARRGITPLCPPGAPHLQVASQGMYRTEGSEQGTENHRINSVRHLLKKLPISHTTKDNLQTTGLRNYMYHLPCDPLLD